MERWKGRVAFITGASSGIGRAVAATLAGNNLRIALCARREERLIELAREIESESGDVMVLPTDLRDGGQVRAAFDSVRAHWGGVDVLFNNAGVGYKTPLYQGDMDRWKEMTEVNILGLSQCAYEAISDMRERGDDGYIINVSSMGAHRHKPGSIGNAIYGATKRAVRSLNESIRMELRSPDSNIRVSSVSPGLVETEFAARYLQDENAGQFVYQQFVRFNRKISLR
ncbi:MAG: SDR family NAD(P)-dependent oxidoreductase [Anaerolineales bacterium]|nr:SDR family NAD(P)-dependent oxidoreductase [Anaerolineales bacterium]